MSGSNVISSRSASPRTCSTTSPRWPGCTSRTGTTGRPASSPISWDARHPDSTASSVRPRRCKARPPRSGLAPQLRHIGIRLTPMATIVAFHAHPDDEVLLAGGTIAWLAAEGHRVVIVMAFDGEMWPDQHRGRRLEELRASAAILGADKAVHLGYADSGAG